MADTDTDRFPVAADAESRPDESGERLSCPEAGCEWSIGAGEPMAKAKLGAHRWNAHGIRGAGGSGASKRKARKDRSSGSAAPSEPRPTSRTKLLREAEQSLVEGFSFLGGMLQASPAQLPGDYLVEGAEQGAAAVAKVAARNDRVLRALTGASAAADYAALGMWTGGLVVSILVMLGRIPYDAPIAGATGVTDLAVKRYGLEQLEAFRREQQQPGDLESDHVGNGASPAGAPVDARPVGAV